MAHPNVVKPPQVHHSRLLQVRTVFADVFKRVSHTSIAHIADYCLAAGASASLPFRVSEFLWIFFFLDGHPACLHARKYLCLHVGRVGVFREFLCRNGI